MAGGGVVGEGSPRRRAFSPRRRGTLVGSGQVAGMEDAERHAEEEVDDPAYDGYRGDEAEHDRVDKADEEEDDDRDDPGPPADPPDVVEDRPEVERLAEAAGVGEPHDCEEGDDRYDDPDHDRDQEPGEGGGDGRGPCFRVIQPSRRYGGGDCYPAEEDHDQDHRDHVDQIDDVPLPPVDKEPAPFVDIGGGRPAGEHPDDVAI